MTNTLLRYTRFGEPETTLELQTLPLASCSDAQVRVKMLLSPVNASDLIPITGAYGHRITPPLVAGYEGVGMVTEAPAEFAWLTGTRVLPLRGQGTWQQYVECPAELAIAVPEDISDALAARAYINPLAAWLMLKHFSPVGKRVLVTAAGSECAQMLGQWALNLGAREVVAVYRSSVHAAKLAGLGMIPLDQQDQARIIQYAGQADIVYDAVGGTLANELLQQLPDSAQFISYGLLSGQPFSMNNRAATLHWFHMRNYLAQMTTSQWQEAFQAIWPLLRQTPPGDVALFPLVQWQAAIAHYRTAGRTRKTMLRFDV